MAIEMVSAEEHRAKISKKNAVLQTILDLATNDLLSWKQACKEIERHAAAALGFPPPGQSAPIPRPTPSGDEFGANSEANVSVHGSGALRANEEEETA